MKTPTYEQIKPYIEKCLITEQRHPENGEVAIFNYSQTCQFERAWDDVTRQCRGLIMNVVTGEVIARPFPKFFNYGEHVEKGWAIPTSTPEVYAKLDGSLGILYELNGKLAIATRGSFTSDQAKWATEWFHKNVKSEYKHDGSKTVLFEIIYPENRIVVSYDFSGLVKLATIDIATGQNSDESSFYEFDWAAKPDDLTVEQILKMDIPNHEGFVLFYPEENVRMKIKFPEYVRLHKLVTGVSEIAIWEHLRDGKGVADLIDKVPDEFMQWVHSVAAKLGKQFEDIRFEVNDFMANNILAMMFMSRKEQADLIKQQKNPGLLFAALDGKDYEPAIWRMIRPHGRSQFKVDIDA